MIAAYEVLRTAVLTGAPHPEGLAAVRYHGMLQGMPMLRNIETVKSTLSPRQQEHLTPALPPDGEFVHLLVNLVLRTHSELTHVY